MQWGQAGGHKRPSSGGRPNIGRGQHVKLLRIPGGESGHYQTGGDCGGLDARSKRAWLLAAHRAGRRRAVIIPNGHASLYNLIDNSKFGEVHAGDCAVTFHL